MPVLTADDIATLIRIEENQKGLEITDNNAVIAIAIALTESSGDSSAVGGPNSDGTYDYGLWQINSIHNPSEAVKTQPVANWEFAYGLSNKGTKWSPWTGSYVNGKYVVHMPEAMAAWNKVKDSSNFDVAAAQPGNGVTDALGINWLLDPHFWLRFAMGLAGGILVFIVVASLMQKPIAAAASFTPIGKALKVAT